MNMIKDLAITMGVTFLLGAVVVAAYLMYRGPVGDATGWNRILNIFSAENSTIISSGQYLWTWKDSRGNIHSGFIVDGERYELEVK